MDEVLGKKVKLDTELERSIIEYRPRVKYELNKPFTVNLPTEEIIEEDQKEFDEDGSFIPEEKPAKQYDKFVGTLELINELIEYIEKKMKGLQVPISIEELEKVYESQPFFEQGIGDEGFIDFETYQKTFENPEAPANSLIQDIVHSYAEDVEGSLELEFYEDLKELHSIVEEGYFLFKETVLKNYLDGNIPKTPEKNNGFTEQIEKAVKKQKQWFDQVTSLYRNNERKYYDALKTQYGSPEFFKISEEYTKTKRPYDVVVRKEKTLNEVISLIDGLLIGSQDCSESIKFGLAIGSEIDGEGVMNLLENQASTKEQLTDLLKLTQLSLKLQLNQQIEDKKQYRDVLKNINNLSRKKRAHDELLMALELRNTMYLNMYDSLQHLESPSKAPGVESFLNQMAGGLSLVQEQYDSFLQDIYAMYMSEYEVRKEKIDKTLNKENARAGYSLVSEYL
ncbi:TPA: hypothetical protein SAX33_005624 [Bacillus cereus]|nr:hypothetical protein [Bacillus cereus]HEF5711805.1 hypothetical protein [Bacillus cereus]